MTDSTTSHSTTNSIVVLGPRGWVASAVIPELASTGARIRTIARASAVKAELPESVEQLEVDWADEEAFVRALEGFDIVLSLVGQAGLADQLRLLPAIKRSGIRLFIPSDFAYVHDRDDEEKVPVMRNKVLLERGLTENGIPFMTVLVGNFAEFALNTPRIGVDIINNRIVHTGRTETELINLCSRAYVAAAPPLILIPTPISNLVGRTIGLNEFRPSGSEIKRALTEKFGKL